MTYATLPPLSPFFALLTPPVGERTDAMLFVSTSIVASRKTYHHGNLREALIEASLDLIAESGPKALTLREAARRAGVSHNAPYRHFQDKDDLLAAVAAQGFRELNQAMLDAAQGCTAALDRLKQSGY